MISKETNVQVVYHGDMQKLSYNYDIVMGRMMNMLREEETVNRIPRKPFIFQPSRTQLGWDICRNEVRSTKVVLGSDTPDLATLKVTGYLFENRVVACRSLSLFHFDWVQLIGRSGSGHLHLLRTRDEKATIVVARYK